MIARTTPRHVLKALGLLVFFLFFASFALAGERYVPTIDDMMADLLGQIDETPRESEANDDEEFEEAGGGERLRADLEEEYRVLLEWAFESDSSREEITRRMQEIKEELSRLD